MEISAYWNGSDEPDLVELASGPREGELVLGGGNRYKVDEVAYNLEEEIHVEIHASERKAWSR